MSPQNLIRLAARLWMATVLVAAFLLTAYSMTAHAGMFDWWNGSKPRTQTDDGTVGGAPGAKSADLSGESITNSDPIYTDQLSEVQQKMQAAGGPYVTGRERLVDKLDNKFATSPSHTVAIIGDDGSGRTAVFEEFIRNHAGDKFFRLNLQKLAGLSEVDATTEFKRFLVQTVIPAGKNAEAGQKVFVYIDRLAGLMQGTFRQPISVLFEQLALGPELGLGENVYVGIETDAETIAGAVSKNNNKYKNLDTLVEQLHVDGASYDTILAQIRRTRGEIERGSVTFTEEAAEFAAYLANKHRRTQPFHFARALLSQAIQLAQDGRLRNRKEEEGPSLNRQRLTAVRLDIANLRTAHETELAHLSATGKTTSSRLTTINGQLEAHRQEELALVEDLSAHRHGQVSKEDLKLIASDMLGIPPNRLENSLEDGIRQIDDIKKVIYNQDDAINAIKSALKVAYTGVGQTRKIKPEEYAAIKAGLEDPRVKPVGSFWFGGRSGVGKTEVAKQLADVLGYPLLRFDMSEFMEKHTVSRLVGAPPGFVGFDAGGELTNAVGRSPYSVVLLDEIEKAHPDILKVLLQVLDDGRLTDSHGKTIDFRNTIIIVTSNLAQDVAGLSPEDCIKILKEAGWSDEKIANTTTSREGQTLTPYLLRREAYKIEAKKERVPPELANRFGAFVVFNDLREREGLQIAQKNIEQLSEYLKFKYEVNLRFTVDAIHRLMNYFNSQEGGRSMEHAFNDFFREPIADLIFENKPKAGQDLIVGISPTGTIQAVSADAGLPSPEVVTIEQETIRKRMSAEDKARLAARSATAELILDVFDKKILVEDHAFRGLRK